MSPRTHGHVNVRNGGYHRIQLLCWMSAGPSPWYFFRCSERTDNKCIRFGLFWVYKAKDGNGSPHLGCWDQRAPYRITTLTGSTNEAEMTCFSREFSGIQSAERHSDRVSGRWMLFTTCTEFHLMHFSCCFPYWRPGDVSLAREARILLNCSSLLTNCAEDTGLKKAVASSLDLEQTVCTPLEVKHCELSQSMNSGLHKGLQVPAH